MNKKHPVWNPQFTDRPLSWSQISSFEWSKIEWYNRYVLFQKGVSTPALEFGNMVDKKLQEDLTFHPEIPRNKHLQHKINTKLGKINMVAIIDSYEPLSKNYKAIIDDYKTGMKKWDKKRLDISGQHTFYTLSLWLAEKVHPKDVELGVWWIPTRENGDFSISKLAGAPVQHFTSSRTMPQLLRFGQYIKDTVKEMERCKKEFDDIHMR